MTHHAPDHELDTLLRERVEDPPVPSSLHAGIMATLEREHRHKSRRRALGATAAIGLAAALAVGVFASRSASTHHQHPGRIPTIPLASLRINTEIPPLALPTAYRNLATSTAAAVAAPLNAPLNFSIPGPTLRLPTEIPWRALVEERGPV